MRAVKAAIAAAAVALTALLCSGVGGRLADLFWRLSSGGCLRGSCLGRDLSLATDRRSADLHSSLASALCLLGAGGRPADLRFNLSSAGGVRCPRSGCDFPFPVPLLEARPGLSERGLRGLDLGARPYRSARSWLESGGRAGLFWESGGTIVGSVELGGRYCLAGLS